MCGAPPQAHGKGTILAAILGQFVVRLPHGARQIDLNFFNFSCFSHPKFPKNIYRTYISQYPSHASYISQHASYMSQYPSQTSYIIISITKVHNANKKVRLTEAAACGTPVGTTATGSPVTRLGTYAEYSMSPICSLKKIVGKDRS
jgi:hypothetical protein